MWSTFTAKYRKGEEAARLQIVRPVAVQVPRTRPSWWPRRGRLPRPPLEVTRSGSTAWARRRGRAARAGGGCEAATSCTTPTWRSPAAWPRPPSSPTTPTSTGGRAVRSVANTSYPGQKMCFIQQNTEHCTCQNLLLILLPWHWPMPRDSWKSKTLLSVIWPQHFKSLMELHRLMLGPDGSSLVFKDVQPRPQCGTVCSNGCNL